MITAANDKNFAELIGTGFTIVDFYSTTCVPCKMFSRVLEDIDMDIPFVNIVKINITDYPEIGAKHQIEAVPTVLFMKDGAELVKEIGAMSESEVLEKISELYYV